MKPRWTLIALIVKAIALLASVVGAAEMPYVVTSIADSGAGTLRDGVDAGERCIVFDVSGTIKLKSTLVIDSTMEILGQTSPGGITLTLDRDASGAAVVVSADSVYLSHLRVRPGGGLPSQKSRDGIQVYACVDCTLDHLSVSFSTDELIDVLPGVERLTVRDCILSEALAFRRDDYPDGHSCGLRVSGPSTVHISRTLFAHCNSRCPLLTGQVKATLSNVVIYNAGSQAIAADGGKSNPRIDLAASGCILISGPNSPKRLAMWERTPAARILARDCWHVQYGNLAGGKRGVLWDKPETSNMWTPDSPDVATLGHLHGNPKGIVANVLRDIGARPWDRDATDRRIIQEVRTGKGGRISHQDEREGEFDWGMVDQPESVRR